MNFVLSTSRLMKASEVMELCKFFRENMQIIRQQEIKAKAEMYRSFPANKEKAAS